MIPVRHPRQLPIQSPMPHDEPMIFTDDAAVLDDDDIELNDIQHPLQLQSPMPQDEP